MWLITTIGFFSVVQKPSSDVLTVRARVKKDLDTLREKYLPNLSTTITNTGSDYPYRATVRHVDFAEALSAIAKDIDYGNFKSHVAQAMGLRRAHLYHKIWRDLKELDHLEQLST